MDELIADAFLAAHLAGSGPDDNVAASATVTTSIDNAVDIIAAAISTDWAQFRQHVGHETDVAPQGNKCKFGFCKGKQLHNVRLYTRPPPGLRFILLPLEHGAMQPVHACSPFCVHTNTSLGKPMTGGLASLLAKNTYTCQAHVKVHVCTTDRCREVFTDGLGFGKCVLSGNVITSAESFSFGDGTGENWHGDLTAEKEVTSAGKPTKHRARAPTFASPPSQPLLPPLSALTAAAATTTPSSRLSAPEQFAPAFDDHEDGNTFGAGLGAMLEELYDAAWKTVHTLLFSAERSDMEERRRTAVEREAVRRVKTYIFDELRNRRPAFLDVAHRLVMKVMDTRRTFPSALLLPKGAISRLAAYYSMAIVECTVNITSVAGDLQGMPDLRAAIRSGDRASGALERIHSYRAQDMACNLLMLLATDFSMPGSQQTAAFWPAAQHDPVLARMPESSVVQSLGFSENTCTDVKKDIKSIVSLAQVKGVPLTRLQCTEIPLHRIIFGTGTITDEISVVAEFLHIRRRRMYAERAAAAAVRMQNMETKKRPIEAVYNDDDDDVQWTDE